MSTIIRTFTVPVAVWHDVQTYRESHPEFNLSGFITGKLKEITIDHGESPHDV